MSNQPVRYSAHLETFNQAIEALPAAEKKAFRKVIKASGGDVEAIVSAAPGGFSKQAKAFATVTRNEVGHRGSEWAEKHLNQLIVSTLSHAPPAHAADPDAADDDTKVTVEIDDTSDSSSSTDEEADRDSEHGSKPGKAGKKPPVV
jgi:hypothetical protein